VNVQAVHLRHVEQAPRTDRLRILVVIPGRPADHTMVFARRQARALAERPDADVEVFFLESRVSPVGLWRARRAFRAHIARFQPQVVHVHYGTMTAFFTVTVSRVPVVVTYHGSDLNRTPTDGFWRDLFGRLLSQFAALGAAGIICVSEALRARLWWRRGKVRIIPMGVELDRYVPIPRDEARLRLSWPLDQFIVIFNASRPGIKRLDIAEATAHAVRASGVDVRLHLLTGDTSQEEMPVLLCASDALLLCSDREGSPTMVKEAMACDLPVVSSDVGDVRERLHGVNPGAVVAQDADELARALLEVHASHTRSNGRALAARNGIDAKALDEATMETLRSCAHHGR